MYGTVARLKVKREKYSELKKVIEKQELEPVGAKEINVFQMDADADELYLVVTFASRDEYKEYAGSQASDENFREMMQFLEMEPEWHDGQVVHHRRY